MKINPLPFSPSFPFFSVEHGGHVQDFCREGEGLYCPVRHAGYAQSAIISVRFPSFCPRTFPCYHFSRLLALRRIPFRAVGRRGGLTFMIDGVRHSFDPKWMIPYKNPAGVWHGNRRSVNRHVGCLLWIRCARLTQLALALVFPCSSQSPSSLGERSTTFATWLCDQASPGRLTPLRRTLRSSSRDRSTTLIK